MIEHNVVQGTPEWHALRATTFNASEAAAMMGVSPYGSRADLLRTKHEAQVLGVAQESDPDKAWLFARGHAAEAAFRPVAEAMAGCEFYPVTGSREVDGLPLLASFDGIDMAGTTLYEHKLFNAELAAHLEEHGEPPHTHVWQLEHQLLVSQAQRALFCVSDGTKEGGKAVIYESKPERRSQLIAGWKQFAEDLATYKPVPTQAKAVAQAIKGLPALVVQVEGKVVATNLAEYRAAAVAFIEGINTNLQSDQDFADAESSIKFCTESEDRLKLVKKQAQSQAATIDELFLTIDELTEMMRVKRLALTKLVDTEKARRKADILQAGAQQLKEHLDKLNKLIGGEYLQWSSALSQRISDAAKGKRSLDTMRDAVDGAVATMKIEATNQATTIKANLDTVERLQAKHLVPDFRDLCSSPKEVFKAIVEGRVAQNLAAAEAARKAKEAQQAAQSAPAMAEPAAAPAAPAAAPQKPVARTTKASPMRPSADAIASNVAQSYGVTRDTAIQWLIQSDFLALAKPELTAI